MLDGLRRGVFGLANQPQRLLYVNAYAIGMSNEVFILRYHVIGIDTIGHAHT